MNITIATYFYYGHPYNHCHGFVNAGGIIYRFCIVAAFNIYIYIIYIYIYIYALYFVILVVPLARRGDPVLTLTSRISCIATLSQATFLSFRNPMSQYETLTWQRTMGPCFCRCSTPQTLSNPVAPPHVAASGDVGLAKGFFSHGLGCEPRDQFAFVAHGWNSVSRFSWAN